MRFSAALGFLGLLGLLGCFLPIPYAEATSPALIGDYRRIDGTPAAGRPIAVTTAAGDSDCVQARVSSITDSAGHFGLRASETRHRGIWVIPAIEHLALNYHLCVGAGDGILRSAFDGIWSLDPKGPPDTLSCIEAQRAEVRCTARGRRYVRRATPPTNR